MDSVLCKKCKCSYSAEPNMKIHGPNFRFQCPRCQHTKEENESKYLVQQARKICNNRFEVVTRCINKARVLEKGL